MMWRFVAGATLFLYFCYRFILRYWGSTISYRERASKLTTFVKTSLDWISATLCWYSHSKHILTQVNKQKN